MKTDEFAPAIEELKKITFQTLEKQTQSMFQQADDFLFDMMNKVNNSKEQTDVLDTIRALRLDKNKFVKTFSEIFQDTLVEEESNVIADLKDFKMEDLALTEEGQLEENIAINNISLKIESTYVWQIQDLNRKLETIDKACDTNYVYMFSPKNIIKPFHKTMSKFEWEIGVKLIIYKLFERSVIANINNLYNEANKILVNMGVSPNVDAIRKMHSSHTPRKFEQANLTPEEQTTQGQPNNPNHNLQNQDGSDNSSNGNAPYNSNQNSNMPPNVPYWARDLWNPNATTQLQPQAYPPFLGGPTSNISQNFGGFIPPDSNYMLFAKEINDALKHFLDGKPNELGKRTALVQKYINQEWQENNFGQESLPILQKMQLPLLQTAHMDETFFTEPEHPIRKLVNEVVKLLDKAYKNKDNSKIEKIIKIIDHVSGNIDDKHTKFVKHNELQPQKNVQAEEFLRQEKERKDKEKEAAENLAWENAKKVVGIEIKRILGNRSLPSVLVEPILGGFATIMAKNRKENGEPSIWKDCYLLIKEIIDLTCGQQEISQEILSDVLKRSDIMLAHLENAKEQEKKMAVISVVLTQIFKKKQQEIEEALLLEKIRKEEQEAEERKQKELERLQEIEREEARLAKQPIDFASLLHDAQEELKELSDLSSDTQDSFDDGVVPVDVYEEPANIAINFDSFDDDEKEKNNENISAKKQVLGSIDLKEEAIELNPITQPKIEAPININEQKLIDDFNTSNSGLDMQSQEDNNLLNKVVEDALSYKANEKDSQITPTSDIHHIDLDTSKEIQNILEPVKDKELPIQLQAEEQKEQDSFNKTLLIMPKIDPKEIGAELAKVEEINLVQEKMSDEKSNVELELVPSIAPTIEPPVIKQIIPEAVSLVKQEQKPAVESKPNFENVEMNDKNNKNKLPDISMAQRTVEFLAPPPSELIPDTQTTDVKELANKPPLFNLKENHEVINLETPKYLMPPPPLVTSPVDDETDDTKTELMGSKSDEKKKSVSNFLNFDLGSLFQKTKKNEEQKDKRKIPPTPPIVAPAKNTSVQNPVTKTAPVQKLKEPIVPTQSKVTTNTQFNNQPKITPPMVGSGNPNSHFPALPVAYQLVFDTLFEKGKWLWVWDGNGLNCLMIDKILGNNVIFTNNAKDQFLKISVFQLTADLSNGQTEMINWDDKISKAMLELSRLPQKTPEEEAEWSGMEFN